MAEEQEGDEQDLPSSTASASKEIVSQRNILVDNNESATVSAIDQLASSTDSDVTSRATTADDVDDAGANHAAGAGADAGDGDGDGADAGAGAGDHAGSSSSSSSTSGSAVFGVGARATISRTLRRKPNNGPK